MQLYSSVTSQNSSANSPSDITIGSQTFATLRNAIYLAYHFQGQLTVLFEWSKYLVLTPYQNNILPLGALDESQYTNYGEAGSLCKYFMLCNSTMDLGCVNNICTACHSGAGCWGNKPTQGNICQDYNVLNATTGRCEHCSEVPTHHFDNGTRTLGLACRGGACNADVACVGGAWCMTGVCLGCDLGCAPMPCVKSRDCNSDHLCQNGVCTACSQGSGCLGDSCDGGTHCQDGLACTALGVCEFE
jgi:hypothetical protein